MQRIALLSAAARSLADRHRLSVRRLSSSSSSCSPPPPSTSSSPSSSAGAEASPSPSPSSASPSAPSPSASADLLPPSGRLLVHGVHIFECQDRVGITAKITECIASRGASILDFGVYVNLDSGRIPAYFARTEFVFDPLRWPRDKMREDFLRLKADFNASTSIVRVPKRDPPMKVAVLVSRKDHCAVDLLHQWQDGKIPIQLTCVVSNHTREEDTHIMRFLSRHNIPYHHVSTNKEGRSEEEIMNLVHGTDFLVLAHYMQVLSPEFLRGYGKDIINIHHGLLPSFKGANPYKQAYEAGVKIIGATSHFVTEELDSGPIIEQMVERVSHRDSLATLAMKSEYLEKVCLAKAIKYYCEMRIIRYSGNRTIVFD